VEELLELALLVLEPLQRLGAVLIEGDIAARPITPRWGPALRVLAPVVVVVPAPGAMPAAPSHASDASTPDQEEQGGKADGPEQNEGQHHQRDPRRFAELVDFPDHSAHLNALSCTDVNVSYIHICAP